ncbi:MAG: HPr family phosphocarrier protein [Collinsella sp.]|nr:HPr family phosphocarrier protein [Collinsella sp.]
MLEKEIIISNATGLHARPAAKLVEVCGPFSSSIFLDFNGKKINAKSIINVMTSGVASGSEVTLRVEGEDEEEAFKAVVDYLDNLPD